MKDKYICCDSKCSAILVAIFFIIISTITIVSQTIPNELNIEIRYSRYVVIFAVAQLIISVALLIGIEEKMLSYVFVWLIINGLTLIAFLLIILVLFVLIIIQSSTSAGILFLIVTLVFLYFSYSMWNSVLQYYVKAQSQLCPICQVA